MDASDNEIINQFLLRYAREFDFYDRAASLCFRHCEEVLGQAAVKAMVTFRAKRPDRLRPKVEKRSEKRLSESNAYKSSEDIYDDIVDLAGVRIALYFPGDMGKVDDIICRAFNVDLKKQFPEKAGPQDPQKRFSGYAATHYRVRPKRCNLPRESERFADCKIEIQVASVLMHAWAEVEHDLAYKPHSGTLSWTELTILDEINGLVLAGELALARLQEAVHDRIAKQNQPFANQYELATHVYEIYKSALNDMKDVEGLELPTTEPSMGRADELLEYLRGTSRNRPELLTQSLRAWTPDPRDNQTIVEQILKFLRREDPAHSNL